MTRPEASQQLERLLAQLVAADSSNPPGDESRVAAVVAEAARGFGLPEPTRHARQPHRPNLVYTLGGGGSPALLVGAHLDTVPAGRGAAWTSPPLQLEPAADGYRGLGVADMKGAVAALLVAAGQLERPLAGRLVIAFTADEEGSCEDGLGWLCEQGLIDVDAAVLLEPASTSDTSWDALYIAQRGSCVVRLEASGKPGHSGEPLPPELRAGTAFVTALSALAEARLFRELHHPLDGTSPLVNLPTMVAGGTTPWQHPTSFEAVIEIRSIPGMTAAMVEAAVRDVLDAHGLYERVRATVASWSEPVPPVNDDRLLDACNHALESVVGLQPPPRVFPATTDATYLTAAGIPTIPAFGPGSLRHVHQPDEWLRRSDLEGTPRLIDELVRAYLTGSSR